MKKILFFLAFAATTLCAWADDLDALQGKWSVKKTGDQGPYTQQIEFKKNKFIFKIITGDQTVFLATGEVELKKTGSFNSARFFAIKAGRTESELEGVDDERNSIYLLGDGVFYLASNFDKARDNEKPGADAYIKSN